MYRRGVRLDTWGAQRVTQAPGRACARVRFSRFAPAPAILWSAAVCQRAFFFG